MTAIPIRWRGHTPDPTRPVSHGIATSPARLAGRTDTLFSDDATTLIHQTSRGYPRAVGQRCGNYARAGRDRPSATGSPRGIPAAR
jgi:hypothetical protein